MESKEHMGKTIPFYEEDLCHGEENDGPIWGDDRGISGGLDTLRRGIADFYDRRPGCHQ